MFIHLVLEGIKTRYGDGEPWKKLVLTHGRTKKSRAPEQYTMRAVHQRSRNDGRPPDTIKDLAPSLKTKSLSHRLPAPTLLHPGYIWDSNLCWLDAALEAIFNVIMRDYSSFASRFDRVPQDSLLYSLFHVIDERRSLYLQDGENNTPQVLTNQRKAFVDVLIAAGFVKRNNFANCFVSSQLIVIVFSQLTNLFGPSRHGLVRFFVGFLNKMCLALPTRISGPIQLHCAHATRWIMVSLSIGTTSFEQISSVQYSTNSTQRFITSLVVNLHSGFGILWTLVSQIEEWRDPAGEHWMGSGSVQVLAPLLTLWFPHQFFFLSSCVERTLTSGTYLQDSNS